MLCKRITALVLIMLLGGTANARVLPGSTPAPALLVVIPGAFFTTMQNLTVPAATISGTNPDSTPNPNIPVAVTWQQKAANNSTWTLTVTAPALTNLTGCTGTAGKPTVPITAVKVTCNSVTAPSATSWTGTCQASGVALSSGGTITLASGNTGPDNPVRNVTANITYSFADDFKYLPASCTVNLSYSVSG